MMVMKLYEKDMYIAPINNVINHYIREYDISKANINILLYLGVIDKALYDELYYAPKQIRQIRIGYLQKDKKIAKALSDGFKYMRSQFFSMNNLSDKDILSIKKDAIYVIDKIPNNTKISNDKNTVQFVCKNTYTSWYRINNIEFYYLLDKANNIENLDIKGISDNMIALHQNYMLRLLRYLFNLASYNRFDEACITIKGFTNSLLSGNEDMNYFRELNNMSMYKTRYVIDNGYNYLSAINQFINYKELDPSHNINIFLDLSKDLFVLFT